MLHVDIRSTWHGRTYPIFHNACKEYETLFCPNAHRSVFLDRLHRQSQRGRESSVIHFPVFLVCRVMLNRCVTINSWEHVAWGARDRVCLQVWLMKMNCFTLWTICFESLWEQLLWPKKCSNARAEVGEGCSTYVIRWVCLRCCKHPIADTVGGSRYL